MHPLFGYLVCYDFGIGIAGKYRAFFYKLISYLIDVCYVAVVRKSNRSFRIVDEHGLGVFFCTPSRS